MTDSHSCPPHKHHGIPHIHHTEISVIVNISIMIFKASFHVALALYSLGGGSWDALTYACVAGRKWLETHNSIESFEVGNFREKNCM